MMSSSLNEFWYLSILGGLATAPLLAWYILHRHSLHHILYCRMSTLHALVCVYNLVFSFRKPFLTHLPEGHAAMNVVRRADERARMSLSYSLSFVDASLLLLAFKGVAT